MDADTQQRLKKQMDFILEIDRSKEIIRQTYLASGARKEDDAEHAWHLAIMAVLLSEYANETVDPAHVMKMVLIHDLVEIDAGDTYAYDTAGNATKRERELKAAERIFSLLPQDQAAEYRAIWDEFEAAKTPEAKFANTLDKIQPVLLTDHNDGISWREHGVREEMIRGRNVRTHEGSEVLWEYTEALITRNVEKGNIIAQET